jgi:hypothetical protein
MKPKHAIVTCSLAAVTLTFSLLGFHLKSQWDRSKIEEDNTVEELSKENEVSGAINR